jgi:hypothetical protein
LKKVPSIAVKFDKIAPAAAVAIRVAGGEILPVEGQPGRYWFVPPGRCRWGGPNYRQTLRLPTGVVIVCLSHDETVELVLG